MTEGFDLSSKRGGKLTTDGTDAADGLCLDSEAVGAKLRQKAEGRRRLVELSKCGMRNWGIATFALFEQRVIVGGQQ